MAVTVATNSNGEALPAVPPGSNRRLSIILGGDSSYPTGGSSLSGIASALGLSAIYAVSVGLNVAGSHLYVWDSANNKLKGFSALGTEISDTTDVSAHRIPMVIWGI